MSSPHASPDPTSGREQRWTDARGARALILLAAVTVAGMGIYSSKEILLPILFGFLFAAAAQPLVLWLEKHHVHSAIAVTAGLVGMVVVLMAASGTLLFGILDLANEVDRYEKVVRGAQLDVTRYLGMHRFSRLAILVQRQKILDIDQGTVSTLVDFSIDLIAFGILAGMVAFFGLLERGSLVSRLSRNAHTAETWQRVLSDTQRYLGIKAVTSAITGILAAAVCVAADLPNAPLWGAIAFWLNFVPVIGSMMAGVPPLLIALATQSPQVASLVLLGYVLINFIIGNIMEPRWQGSAAGMSPLVIVLAIAVWGALLGPLGALVAVPLTMVIKIGCFHTGDLSWVARLLDEGHSWRRDEKPLSDSHSDTPRTSIFG